MAKKRGRKRTERYTPPQVQEPQTLLGLPVHFTETLRDRDGDAVPSWGRWLDMTETLTRSWIWKVGGDPKIIFLPPPEPGLEWVIQGLQSIPPIEFVRWRQEASILADWLEERGDERGTQLRTEVGNALGNGKRWHSSLVQLSGMIITPPLWNIRAQATENWQAAMEWILEADRFEILQRCGLALGLRHPHVGEQGGYAIPSWIVRDIQRLMIQGAVTPNDMREFSIQPIPSNPKAVL